MAKKKREKDFAREAEPPSEKRKKEDGMRFTHTTKKRRKHATKKTPKANLQLYNSQKEDGANFGGRGRRKGVFFFSHQSLTNSY